MKKKAKVRGKSASIAAAKGHTNGGKTAHPAVSQSLSLLSEISQEITSVLDRDELFGRIADHGRLCASHISPGFVALLFAHRDMEKGRLRIANAGIPWPILVRDARAQELKIDGMPLGIFPDLDYEILEFATQPQDIFVLASDGILESMNAWLRRCGRCGRIRRLGI